MLYLRNPPVQSPWGIITPGKDSLGNGYPLAKILYGRNTPPSGTGVKIPGQGIFTGGGKNFQVYYYRPVKIPWPGIFTPYPVGGG